MGILQVNGTVQTGSPYLFSQYDSVLSARSLKSIQGLNKNDLGMHRQINFLYHKEANV